VKSREEMVKGIAVLTQESRLVLHAGTRHLTLKISELDHYRGERGRRGSKLPRGLQNVDYVVAEHPDAT
jgi:topoisomerase-4 subunit A